MKRIFLIILTFFIFFTNITANAASKVTSKDYKVISEDGFNMYANLSYIKDKKKTNYPTVVLLHSLGYNSEWWGTLPQTLIDSGYAVIKIDLRGHGKSNFNKYLVRVSWKNLTNNAYAKYPSDVQNVLKTIKEDNKHTFFNKWAIVGSDIGASTGVLVADKMTDKPKTIIMISPVVKTKNLYIPVSVAQLDNTDFLAIIGAKENDSIEASKYLKKFAQENYVEYISKSEKDSMVLLKNDESIIPLISEWLKQYFNN